MNTHFWQLSIKVAYGRARASTGNGRSWQRFEKRSTGVEVPRGGHVFEWFLEGRVISGRRSLVCRVGSKQKGVLQEERWEGHLCRIRSPSGAKGGFSFRTVTLLQVDQEVYRWSVCVHYDTLQWLKWSRDDWVVRKLFHPHPPAPKKWNIFVLAPVNNHRTKIN